MEQTLEKFLSQEVYGRICTSYDGLKPKLLSMVPGRKVVFLFGPDTIGQAVRQGIQDPRSFLERLGYTLEYIHKKVCEDKRSFWLVLIKQQESNKLVLPGTWDGVFNFIQRCYPEALPPVRKHWSPITSKPIEYFEKQAGFRFSDVGREGRNLQAFHLDYEKLVSISGMPSDWQIRLFLYSELRLLDLFKGDGYTYFEDGRKGEKEYLSLNTKLEQLGEDCLIVPLSVQCPLH